MTARKADTTIIPDTLRPLFWDSDFDQLRWERDWDFVTGRILASGEWEAVQWLRTQLDDAALREWLENRKGGRLSPQRLRFWELILHIPHRTANAWLEESARTLWARRMTP